MKENYLYENPLILSVKLNLKDCLVALLDYVDPDSFSTFGESPLRKLHVFSY